LTRYIVLTGGVISGVGKGVSTASLGRILQEYGFSVTAVKIDPYINCDAGTLRPTEHGEVWVTDDGGEIDQDLGNYERFLGKDLSKKNNITTGQIYKAVIDRERRGEYLGKTVQFIPHITNEIKRRIKDAGKGFDFCLIEIGGTVGDYENIPFLFAVKSLEQKVGKENLIYFLVTYLVVPRHMNEMKTKPTQQAIKMLNESGIFPDFILCRGPRPLDSIRRKKIETYANIKSEYVISEPDIDTIYRIPLDLEKEKVGLKILKKFKLRARKKANWGKWRKLVERIVKPKHRVKIAIIGKYLDIGDFTLEDSYVSIKQALIHAGAYLNTKIEIKWVNSKILEEDNKRLSKLKECNGIIVPGGFGASGVNGKINAIRFARENNIPFLGICYGMQLAIIEFARNVCGLEGANTTENDANTNHPVIDILPKQKKIIENYGYGGSMRLGAYAAILDKKSMIFKLYKKTGRLKKDKKKIEMLKKENSFRLGLLGKEKNVILERHRHRYEVSPLYVKILEKKGMKFSGYHLRRDKTKLMEFIELPNLRFFCATQSHPEFKSRLSDPAPLFLGFVRACMGR